MINNKIIFIITISLRGYCLRIIVPDLLLLRKILMATLHRRTTSRNTIISLRCRLCCRCSGQMALVLVASSPYLIADGKISKRQHLHANGTGRRAQRSRRSSAIDGWVRAHFNAHPLPQHEVVNDLLRQRFTPQVLKERRPRQLLHRMHHIRITLAPDLGLQLCSVAVIADNVAEYASPAIFVAESSIYSLTTVAC